MLRFFEALRQRFEVDLGQIDGRRSGLTNGMPGDGIIEYLVDLPQDVADVRRVGIQLDSDRRGQCRYARHALGALQHDRIRLHSAKERSHQPLMSEELATRGLRRDQRVDGVRHRGEPLHGPKRQLLHGGQVDTMACTERRRAGHGVPERSRQLRLVLERVRAAFAGAVDGECLLQRSENVRVVDDHAAVLPWEYSICARNRLHQRVIPHRLVEVHRGATRCIEASEPHGADEYQAQRIVGVFELLVQSGLRLVHAPAMRLDVETQTLHVLNLVLRRRYDDRHVGGRQHLQALLEARALSCPEVIPAERGMDECLLCLPVRLHLVVHPKRGGLVDRHHHRLPHEPAAQEVLHDVARNRVQAVVTRDQVILPPEHLLQLVLLIVIEIGVLDDAVDVVIQIRIDELQLRCAVLVEQRDRGTVFDRLLEVVDGDVVAEDFLGPLLAGNERCAREGQKHRLGQCRPHVER